MYEADRPVTLLYLVNVMQPVSLSPLKKRLRRFTVGPRQNRLRQEGVDAILGSLMDRGLVSKRGDKYSVTATGLRKLASFGLGHVRDKNRLLFLNQVL
jgi:hypothetical protein